MYLAGAETLKILKITNHNQRSYKRVGYKGALKQQIRQEVIILSVEVILIVDRKLERNMSAVKVGDMLYLFWDPP